MRDHQYSRTDRVVGQRTIIHINVADFAVAVERLADPGSAAVR